MSETGKKPLRMLVLCSIAIIPIWSLMKISGADDYLNYIQQSSNQAIISTNGRSVGLDSAAISPTLLETIQSEADKGRISAIDAKVDRVWKAVPGYNGLEVDIMKTFELHKQAKSDQPIHYIYKEIKPKVGLKELGAFPIYKGNPHKPMISLLINVAWGEEFLPAMLKVLNNENVHATFFFDGSWLLKHMETADAIGKAGHELSNHAYSHKNMSQLSRVQATNEIFKTEQLLNKLGINNTLFAPPSGDYDNETVQIAHELQLNTILWSIDTLDWKKPGSAAIIEKVTKQLENGSMILMHPTEGSSLSLEAIIKEVKRKGLVVGTVSELISSDRVKPDQGMD